MLRLYAEIILRPPFWSVSTRVDPGRRFSDYGDVGEHGDSS
jgi:hypothetical protein